MSVIGELKENVENEKDESNRWINCEGYDTYYEPHSELMFMLETMIFYKKRYFKEYFSEEEEDIKLSHSLVDNNKGDEEWIPYFTNDIVRPEIMLKRDDMKIFDKNCQIIGNNNRKALEQSDITNKRNLRTKNTKNGKNESLVLREVDDSSWNSGNYGNYENYGNSENSEGINIKYNNNENAKNIQNDINNKNSKENHMKVVRQVNNTKQILDNH
ncbi:10468_t:CDS:2 [Diversispora eburnea]|uniref:10468_t:CDS:1 n=1 Tax=Diversispora eburnea TaxID=1213867 RepID=A0A9N9CFQ7_9GLOM|nr:10468_t:CDS:2 [Diversispora eburnea]